MSPLWRKVALALLAPLVAVACEQAGTAFEPVETAAEPRAATAAAAAQPRVTLLRAAAAAPLVVQGVADFRGGMLRAGGHTLTIPAHAVVRPTLFRMEVVADGYVHVELDAYERDAAGNWTVDVGSRGFRRPIRLALSYDGSNAPEGAPLFVVWAKDGTPSGELVRQPGSVDARNRWIIAYLDHFSGYLGGSGNRSDEQGDDSPENP